MGAAGVLVPRLRVFCAGKAAVSFGDPCNNRARGRSPPELGSDQTGPPDVSCPWRRPLLRDSLNDHPGKLSVIMGWKALVIT